MPERRLEGRGGSATATPSVDEKPRKGRRGRKDSRCEDTGEQERAGAQGNGGCSAWGVQCQERRREAGRTAPGGDEGAAKSLATAAEEANHTTPEGKGCTTAARPRGPNSAPGTPGSPRGGAGRARLSSLPVLRPEKRDHCTMLLETKPREI